MVKILSLAAVMLLLTAFASAQTKNIDAITQQIRTLKVEKSISLEYDKSSNYSKLMMISDGFGSEQNKKNGLSYFTFGIMHGFTGRELTNAPDVFILTFWTKGRNTRFAESHTWKAVVDGETIELGDARYARKSGDEREFLNFVVARENLEKISQGKDVTFTIGNAEFKIPAENLRMFASLLRIADPMAE